MKKITTATAILTIPLILGFSQVTVAAEQPNKKNKCVVQLTREDGSKLYALLSKKDCKKVNPFKKGEKVELCGASCVGGYVGNFLGGFF